MNALQSAFAEKDHVRLIPFIMTGDPNLAVTIDIIELLEQEGVAAIELGVPFSDPMADGPVIQAAATRALDNRVHLQDVLEVAKAARKRGCKVPFILFSYYNPLLQYGLKSLVHDAKQAGFSGMIVPDLPFEESDSLREMATEVDVALIPLVAPTSEQRISAIVKHATGFVYCVSSLGTTGVRHSFSDEVITFLEKVRELSPVPTAVGFGISKAEHVQTFAQYADAVIVGSALVQKIEEQSSRLSRAETKAEGLQQIREFVRGLKSK